MFLSPPVNIRREVLYGGAAGGGKSDALLMGALQFVDVPGYSAILFRRSYTDLALPDALMPRAQEWLANTDAHWHGQDKTWTFPSGATLTFGYLEYEKHKLRYQSSAFQYIGLDELTQFTETQYTYLFSRLRRLEGIEIPLRMRVASNPGGPGHDWVKQRFLVESSPERVFIPASLEDNPHLDRDEYRKSLRELDPTTRQQLLDGNWDVLPSGYMFRREWFPIIEPHEAEQLYKEGGWRWVRFWDLAATPKTKSNDPDATAGLLMGTDGEKLVIADVIRVQEDSGAVKRLVGRTAEEDWREVAVRMEQEPGQSGKDQIREYRQNVLAQFDFKGVPSTGSKEVRARPVAGRAAEGDILLVRAAWNRPFLNELVRFPDDAVHDDQVDATSGAYNCLSLNVKRPARSFQG